MNGFGDPAAVTTAAQLLNRAAATVRASQQSAARAEPEAWRGAAAEAFRTSLAPTVHGAQTLSDTLTAGSATLARYAHVQAEAAAAYAQAQSGFDRASAALKTNALDVMAMLNVLQCEWDARGAIARVNAAAAVAAAELDAAAGVEGDARPWWDPFGWFNDPEEPDERVSDDILDDDAFDPDDVDQGSIGDCFMLSTVVSLLSTDEGDAFVREHIRWDAEREGYWVTIYPNGEAKEVFVDYVYDDGARQSDWEWLFLSGSKPSIAALYEAAIQEEYGYSYLDGGVPADAMALITGENVETIENPNYGGLSASQLSQANEVLTSGGQVVLSSPRSGEHELTVTAPDGSTRVVDVVTSHSYAVTRIEADGSVWMRNPWGPGNSADGGGEFRVDAEDVSRLFWRTTYTNVTEE